jgi:hypothetical protein
MFKKKIPRFAIHHFSGIWNDQPVHDDLPAAVSLRNRRPPTLPPQARSKFL